MPLLLFYKPIPQISSLEAKMFDLSSYQEARLLDLTNMVFTGQEITMRAGHTSRVQLLITSTVKCSEYKWLDPMFVASEEIQLKSSARGGSNWQQFILLLEIIQNSTQSLKNRTPLETLFLLLQKPI